MVQIVLSQLFHIAFQLVQQLIIRVLLLLSVFFDVQPKVVQLLYQDGITLFSWNSLSLLEIVLKTEFETPSFICIAASS